MDITHADFDTTIAEFMGGSSITHATFDDAPADDYYTIRMQKIAGQLSGSVDCMCKLNGQNAWQVQKLQPNYITVGALLMQIASARGNAHEFFSNEGGDNE